MNLIEKRSSGGLTALMLAAKANSVHSVKILLELGADPNQVDNDGRSAKSYARTVGTENKVTWLLEKVDKTKHV